MKEEIILATQNIVKEYRIGKVSTKAVAGVSLDIHAGEFVAITGKSGSGKSTLMYQMSLLDHPTSGEVMIRGVSTTGWGSSKRVKTRLSEFGYVFQDYALVPELSALENVALPFFMKTGNRTKGMEQAQKMLESVGLGTRLNNHPSQLSGGEQQRVSIARALVNNPSILFADEPTANLDTETSSVVMDIIHDLHKKGLTVIMVTHEPEYAEQAERIITMQDGLVI